MGTLKLSKLRHLSNALKHHLKALSYVHVITQSTRIRYAGKLHHLQIRPFIPKASTETHGLITLPIMRQTKLLSPTNTNVSKEIFRIKPRIRPWDHSGFGGYFSGNWVIPGGPATTPIINKISLWKSLVKQFQNIQQQKLQKPKLHTFMPRCAS